MSALPLPAIQSLSTTESTRTLPPAPVADQDRPRSFAAALERQSERPGPAAAPADRPSQDEQTATPETAQRPATGQEDTGAPGHEDAPATPVTPTAPTATSPVAGGEPQTDAGVMAEQAALVATLAQILTTTAVALDSDAGITSAPVATGPTLPLAMASGGDDAAMPATAITAPMTTATLPGTAPVDPVATGPTQALMPGIGDAIATIASQTAATAMPADPKAGAGTEGAPAAQASAIMPAATPAIAPVDAGALSTSAPAALPTQAVASAPATHKPAGAAAATAATTPIATGDGSLPVIAEAAASDVERPIAAIDAAIDMAVDQQLPDQGAATTVPLATPTATTNAMQSTAQQLGIGKDAQIQAPQDERPLAAVTDRTATEVPAAAPSAPATQTRTVGFEQVLGTMPTGTPPNPMDKAVANQISRALVQQLPNGDRMMTLRLTPPELGTVRIEVVERQGVLTARLHAEDDGVRLALEKALPLMRQELRASDAPVRDVQVGDQSRFDQAHSQQQGQGQADRNGRRRGEDEPAFSLDGSAPARELPRAAARALGGRADGRGVDALA